MSVHNRELVHRKLWVEVGPTGNMRNGDPSQSRLSVIVLCLGLAGPHRFSVRLVSAVKVLYKVSPSLHEKSGMLP